MTDDDLEAWTTNFMYALAASDANVANISADQTEQGMRVTFDLLDPDDTDVVAVARRYDGERTRTPYDRSGRLSAV
jgi:hypothetical protein